jgi:bacteriophage N4 adsorption protein B
MANTTFAAALWIEFILAELLLFSGVWFFIGAIDDICVDFFWAVRRLYRRFRYYRATPPMRAHQLPQPNNPGELAIFIAAWQESAVIGAMLRRCQHAWASHHSHTIYVGCYPNDEPTIAAVLCAAADNPAIKIVLCHSTGPTTKADCLNRLWEAMTGDELALGRKFKAIILHDAEDMVDPDELPVYDRLIETASAVQLPVIPVKVLGSRWISGHYCDEFAEAHGKSLVVREAIGASLPLAGVGCAIERNMLGRIALANNLLPFDVGSLTEDYELGLKIGQQGGKTILVRLLNKDGVLIGTRACFPHTLAGAVRQKARWLTGISLSGWDRVGWRSSLGENWMILRDRKSVFAAIVLSSAYLCILLAGFLSALHFAGLFQWHPLGQTTIWLLNINALFLMWRIIVRAFFVGKLYGIAEGLVSIPRSFVANIIALMAARRAVVHYLRHCISGQSLRWEKTDHIHFPIRSDDVGLHGAPVNGARVNNARPSDG